MGASLRLIALGVLVLAVIVHASLPDLLRREFEEEMMQEEEKKTINVEEPEEKEEVEAKEEGKEVEEEEVYKKTSSQKFATSSMKSLDSWRKNRRWMLASLDVVEVVAVCVEKEEGRRRKRACITYIRPSCKMKTSTKLHIASVCSLSIVQQYFFSEQPHPIDHFAIVYKKNCLW